VRRTPVEHGNNAIGEGVEEYAKCREATEQAHHLPGRSSVSLCPCTDPWTTHISQMGRGFGVWGLVFGI